MICSRKRTELKKKTTCSQVTFRPILTVSSRGMFRFAGALFVLVARQSLVLEPHLWQRPEEEWATRKSSTRQNTWTRPRMPSPRCDTRIFNSSSSFEGWRGCDSRRKNDILQNITRPIPLTSSLDLAGPSGCNYLCVFFLARCVSRCIFVL